MNHPSPTSLTPAVMLGLLLRHRYLWLAPAVAGFALAAFYSLVTPRTWSASQGLIVRSEAAGYTDQRLGKFTDLSEMKTVQETVLELARSQSVVTAVLEEVGPVSARSGDWPTKKDIAKFRKRLTITPPGGAEFGATEVFYVEVQDNDPQRAERLVATLAEKLEDRLQSLRNQRATSMVQELERSVTIAEESLTEDVERLAGFETQLGPQLGELRNLISSNGSQSSIDMQKAAIEQELRQLETTSRRTEQLLTVLQEADQHPERLLAAPSSLLAAHPTMLRLKDGLATAQIRTAAVQGSRTDNHPLTRAARETERNLRGEIDRHRVEVVRGVEMELAVSTAREKSLKSKLTQLHATQSQLATKRALYAQLLANVENQTHVIDKARKQLSDARAHKAGASSASVLARLDNAEAGLYPLGPGRTVVSLAGGLAGLIAGLGAVLLFHAPSIESTPPAPEAPAQSATPAPAPRQFQQEATAHADNATAVVATPFPVCESVFVGS